mgnify:CR=1 FL=1
MSSDTAGKLDVIRDAFKRSEEYYNSKFDYLVDLDATAPLRLARDIINSFNQFKENNNDNLITAMPSRRSPYFNLVEQDKDGNVYLSKTLDNSIKVPDVMLQSNHFIFVRTSSPKFYVVKYAINPEFFKGPINKFTTEDDSEYHPNNIKKYRK